MNLKKFLSVATILVASCFAQSASAQENLASTYFTNADFSSTEGWTSYKSKEFTNTGMGLIGTLTVNGVASVADPTHTESMNCAGVSARWDTNYAAWQQTSTSALTPGEYLLSFDVANPGDSKNYNMGNLTYVEVGGEKFYDTGMTAANLVGAKGWVSHSIKFTVTSASTVTLSLGYQNNENQGSGFTPELFFSNLKLADVLSGAKAAFAETITNAEAQLSTYEEGTAWYTSLSSAITTAKATDQTDVDALESATTTLKEAMAAANEKCVTHAKVQDALDKAKASVAKCDANAQKLFDASAFEKIIKAGTMTAAECDDKIVEINAAWSAVVNSSLSFMDDTDVTPLIKNADCEKKEGWTTSGSANGPKSGDAVYDGNLFELTGWGVNATGDLTQTVTDIPSGLYELSFVYMAAAGTCRLQVIANEQATAELIGTGTAEGDTGVKGWHKVNLPVIVAGNTLTITAKGKNGSDNQVWTNIDDFHLTYTRALTVDEINENRIANDTEIAAYNTAIKTFESKIGFEKGEYAPYNNIAAIEALAVAKVDVTTAKATAVIAATAAIEAIELPNANASEVNAIYDGTFGEHAYKEEEGKNEQAIGWTGDSGHDTEYFVRHMYNGAVNAGLAAASSGEAMMIKHGASYGKTAGYTMPLKATTAYKLTFKHGGWGNIAARNLTVTTPNGATIKLNPAKVTAKDNSADSDAASWTDYEGVFTTAEAGNYVLNLEAVVSGQDQLVCSDIKLVKAPVVEVALTVTDAKYATFIAPFDVAVPAGVTASTVQSVDGTALVLTDVEGGTIPANTPVVLSSETPVNKTVSGQDISIQDSYTTGLLTGVYAETKAPVGSYVLQNQGGAVAFYVVEDVVPTVGANRAYLTAPAAGVKAFTFDGEATAIESLNAVAEGNAARYNAAGVKVAAPVKGLNIIKMSDGSVKKVYIK